MYHVATFAHFTPPPSDSNSSAPIDEQVKPLLNIITYYAQASNYGGKTLRHGTLMLVPVSTKQKTWFGDTQNITLNPFQMLDFMKGT